MTESLAVDEACESERNIPPTAETAHDVYHDCDETFLWRLCNQNCLLDITQEKSEADWLTIIVIGDTGISPGKLIVCPDCLQ